jgi:hypothetical protein
MNLTLLHYYKYLFTIVILGSLGFFTSCVDNQYPDDIWDPNDRGLPSPVITSLSPSDSAFAGSDIITINGENFSSNPEEIFVYFNSELGEVLESSKTEIVVSPPNFLADSVIIKIAVGGAFLFGEYDRYYTLYPRIIKYGNFDSFEESVWGLEADNSENLYVGLFDLPEGDIERLTPPNAERDSSFIHSMLPTPSSMRIGPDNDMYYVDGFYEFLIKHNMSSGQQSYAALPGKIADLDFDINGNLYCGGGGNAIYTVQSDLTSITSADYTDININAIRVFDSYLYVAGNYLGESADIPSTGIWRNQITSSSGSLGEKELVLDWVVTSGTDSRITCLTFDKTGKMYISSDGDIGVATVNVDGSFNLLYPKIVFGPIAKMTWGAGNYLYLNYRGSSRAIYRLELSELGAPYYGRP